MELGDKLYFYDAADTESVGTIVEYHAKKLGRKEEHYYIVALKNKRRIRVTELGWETFDCDEFEDVVTRPISPIRKGAVVNVTDDDVVYEADVLSLPKGFYGEHGYFQVRFRKFVSQPKGPHPYSGATKAYTQSVPLNRLTIVKNGIGRRLLRGKRK